MGDTWKCLQCGKRIDKKHNKCGCGYTRYGKNNEYAPNMSLLKKHKKARKREQIFSDEEILALGLYPKDEGYKMSLISRILGRK